MNNEEKIISMLEQQTIMLEGIATRVDNLEAKVDNLETKVDNLEVIVTETKDRMVLMENDHGQKLGALFDGYKLLFDMMGKLRAGFDKLESEQEKHGFMIRWQEASRKKTS